MNVKHILPVLSIAFVIVQFSCSSPDDGGMQPGPTGPTVDELIAQGWQAFESGDFQTANSRFNEARQKDSGPVDIFTGLGWSFFRIDNLTQARNEFQAGSGKSDAPADLFAGWAFVLNALKDYRNSNAQATRALSLDAAWGFSHGSGLNTDDLHVLKAENHFLLIEFSESLAEVQSLNPSFSADIKTTTGRQELAAEIERLKLAAQ
ncbi:MAG: tetratricopeptide repeat protein [bacterium]